MKKIMKFPNGKLLKDIFEDKRRLVRNNLRTAQGDSVL